jgi:hypothetical protein
MSRSHGNCIADTLELSLDYANRLLAGIGADRFARFAAVGATTVESNHPAFVLGHLGLYGPKIVSLLGGTPALVPERFAAVFSKDDTCVDDAAGTTYPPMAEVVEVFRHGCTEAIAALRAAPDDVLQRPTPMTGRMAELFPTVGSLAGFLAGSHMMMHLGQVSAWRRMEGLGPA